MITPSALATSTYYKIGVDSVSFAWNYTSLAVTPSKIDVLVSCSANQATYTVASNASFEKTGSVVWDTRPEETGEAPLLTETYTLIIHDAEKAVTEVAGAGHLGSYDQFQFGMYLPQKYTPRAGELSSFNHFRMDFAIVTSANVLRSRLEMSCLQRCDVGCRETGHQIHVWDVWHHDSVIHLVRRRFWSHILMVSKSLGPRPGTAPCHAGDLWLWVDDQHLKEHIEVSLFWSC